MPTKIDMKGVEFNGCLVVSDAPNAGGRTAYNCVCFCGNEFVATTKAIRDKSKRSCGCLAAKNAKTHGLSRTKAYRSWAGMIQRCTNKNNPKYSRYGGRGIMVDVSWFDFANFIGDMGRPESVNMSIGRIDNDGNYCKENCRWETPTQQACNTSRSHKFDWYGEMLTAGQIARRYGLKQATVYSRLINGFTGDDVIFNGNLGHVMVSVNGCEMLVTKALQMLSIPVSTYCKRISEGFTSQQVIDNKIKNGAA